MPELKLKQLQPELKLKQLQNESDTWKRLLGFILEENIHLKNRLSEILKDRFDKELLKDIEVFQTDFINTDNQIWQLQKDVAEFDKLILRDIFEDGGLKKDVTKQIKNLRSNITNAELQFEKLKSEFNNYLTENL